MTLSLDLGIEQPRQDAAASRLVTLKGRLLADLARLVEASGLTQSAAAERIGVDQPTLSKALSGRLTTITVDRLLGWLDALGQPYDLVHRHRDQGPNDRRTCLIQQASSVSIWERDLVTGEDSWSDSAYDLYGWPRDRPPPAYEEWLALIHPDDRQRVRDARSGFAPENASYENEFRIVRPNGEQLWVLNRAIAEFDGEGRPIRVYGANIDITARREAEAALREREATLRLVARVGRVGYFSWDPRSGVATCSPEYRQIYGLPAERDRLDFDSWVALIHPDDRSRILADIAAATVEAALVENEHRIVRADTGEVRWVLNRSEIERDAYGNVARVVGAQFDITDQKQVEAAARASEARLRVAQRAAHAVTWEYDAVTGITYWSDPDTLADIAGVDLGASTRLRDWVMLIHPDDKANYFAEWTSCLASGEGRVQFRIRRRGEIRFIEVFGKVSERNVDGTPTCLIGMTTDVTARQEMADSLETSEKRLRLAVEASRMAIFDHDIDTDQFSHSSEFNRMLGLPPGDLDIRQVRACYAPGEMERLRDLRSEAIARGDRFIDAEFQMITAAGEPRWFLMRAETRLNRYGKAFGTSGVILDITARKNAEAHQRLLIDELNHRTKNQLAIVQSIAQQTFRGAAIDPELRRAFEGRLGALSAAHNLLTRRNWESAPLAQLIFDTVAAVTAIDRVEIAGPGLMLSPKTGVSLAMAVHELATNALKHGSLSAPEGRVSVRWLIDDGRLRLRWVETGGTEVRAPTRRGFGTRMIERGLAAELGGVVKIEFPPEGTICTIDAPLPRINL